MATQRTLKLNLLADVDKFGKGLKKAGQDAKGFGGKVKAYGKIAAAALAAVGVAASVMATKLGLDAVNAASDLNEEISKTEIIFGNVSDEIKSFAKTADKALGLTQKEALSAAGTFAILGKNAGLSGKELSAFSKKMVTLSADIGAFYNTSPEEAITAIGSALRGEAEPIRKYGVLISAASLEQAALNYENANGIELERDKKNQLTETSKVFARYQALLDQTSDAQGNFALTSGDLAGQQKILTAQLENLKTTFGQNLLPIMKKVVTQANFIAAAFGGKDPESLSERARELAGTYDGQGAGGYNLGLALKNLADAFGKLFASLNNDKDADGTLNSIANALLNVANGINAVAGAYKKVKTIGGQILDFLEIGQGGLKFADTGLGKRLGYTNRAAGGSVMAGQPYKIGEFGSEIFVPSGSGSIRPDKGNGGNTFIFNGVIDGESARRSIERLMQQSTRRTGAVNLAGSQL